MFDLQLNSGFRSQGQSRSINSYFNTTFTISDYKLPPMHQMPTPLQQLNHISLDESDVFKALIQLNPSKAQGCDNISPYVLKYCATSLTSPITKCLSLDSA